MTPEDRSPLNNELRELLAGVATEKVDRLIALAADAVLRAEAAMNVRCEKLIERLENDLPTRVRSGEYLRGSLAAAIRALE